MSLELTVGDTAPTLSGTVSADLTAAAAVVHIRRPDKTVISRVASIPGSPTNAWSLALTVGDLSIRGTYYTEVQVTFSGGAIQTFSQGADGNPTTFYVRDQIA